MARMTMALNNPHRFLAVILLTALAGCENPEFGMQPSGPTTAEQQRALLQVDLQRNPNDSAALRQIGDMDAKAGRWSPAMGAYREALLVNPADREARLGFGEGQLAQGDYAGALQSAQQAGGGDVRVILLRAGALAGLGQLTEARQVLDRANATEPRNLDVRMNIAIVGALAGDPQAYAIGRAAAFAPDASFTHRRNLVLVGGISGNEAAARQDGAQLGLDGNEVNGIISVGRNARSQGMRAFGVMAHS